MQNIDIIFSQFEKFNGNYTDDFDEWDKFIASLKPDLYISTAYYTTHYSCPRIVVLHDIIPIIYSSIFSPEKVAFYSKAINSAVSDSDLIIANSEFTKKDIVKHFGNQCPEIKVLYPHIESILNRITSSKQVIAMEPGNFIVLGVKDPRKNVKLVVDALAILKRQGINYCKVSFVGKLRELSVPLQQWIIDYDLKDVTEVLDYLSDIELIRLIHSSRGLLFSSLYEGFGIPLLEFLAADKPVICLENTSITEVMKDLAYYSNNEPNEFAKMMLKVFHHGPNHTDPSRIRGHFQMLIRENHRQFQEIRSWISSNSEIQML